ncbi:cytoplasmic dynein 2 heavy chain 1, partial [Caerostris extrusa]
SASQVLHCQLKAIPKPQLLGYIDLDTREWHDGVDLTSNKEQDDVSSWIICDGDIDPEWIESLNSVLDDNRLLTMPSGERIQFGSNVNFLFETHDLSCASPATISRMGIIFLSNEDVNVKSLVTAWLLQQDENNRLTIETFIEDYFYKALDWVLKQIFSWANLIVSDPNSPSSTYYNERTHRLEVYEMQDDESLMSDYESNSSSIIQTEDCLRTMHYLSPWLLNEKRPAFLLVGPDGCGKSTLLRNCLQQEQTISSAMVHCNAQTKPHHILQKLMSVCTIIGAQSGRILRPKESEHLVLYLRDLSLPKPDKWGTSQLLAWLQQVSFIDVISCSIYVVTNK